MIDLDLVNKVTQAIVDDRLSTFVFAPYLLN